MPHTTRSAAASLRSLAKPGSGGESPWLLSLCEKLFPRQWKRMRVTVWESLQFATGRTKSTHSFIVLSCACSYCANLAPVEPGPDAVVHSSGAGGSGAGAMGACWKGCRGFSSLWVRSRLLSHRGVWWSTFLMGYCWLVLISRIPHFWSTLEGQGGL